MSLKVLLFNRLHMVSYYGSIETLSLRSMRDIQLQNAVTLKTGLLLRQDHWKCRNAIDRVCFLLTFYSNYGAISCRFGDIQYRKMSTLKSGSKVIESGIIR